jgi:starch phosphorylase
VIFGLTASEVLGYYATGAYSAWDEYNTNAAVRRVMDQLIDGTYGDFRALYDSILNSNDEFFIMKDFGAYCRAQEKVLALYKNKFAWLRSSAINIANAGRFSSDRTISEYAADIWDIKPVLIP